MGFRDRADRDVSNNLRLHHRTIAACCSCRPHESDEQERRGVLTHNEIVLFRRSEHGTALVRFDVGSHVPYHGYLVHRVSW